MAVAPFLSKLCIKMWRKKCVPGTHFWNDLVPHFLRKDVRFIFKKKNYKNSKCCCPGMSQSFPKYWKHPNFLRAPFFSNLFFCCDFFICCSYKLGAYNLLWKICEYIYFSCKLHLFTIFTIYWTKLPSQIEFWRSNYGDSEIFWSRLYKRIVWLHFKQKMKQK